MKASDHSGGQLSVAIEGPCGSGKSTLANHLLEIFGDQANLIHMDDFFLPLELRTTDRLAEPGGNIDYVRFHAEIACPMRIREVFTYQTYDCSIHRLAGYVTVHPRPLTIVEGVYSLHPALGIEYGLKIFLSLSKDEQRRRVISRSGKELWKRFGGEWIPMENRYFDGMGIRSQCDLILGDPYV